MKFIYRFFLFMLILVCLGCNVKRKLESNFRQDLLISEIWQKGNTLEFISYFPDGNVESRGEVGRDRKKRGAWRYYYEDGRVKAEGQYQDNYRMGIWHYHHNNRSYTVDWTVFLERPFKMNIPRDWKLVKDSVENMPLLLVSANGTNLNVYKHRNVSENLDSFALRMLSETHDAGLVRINSKEAFDIRGQKGVRVAYDIYANSVAFVAIQYYFSFSKDIYVLSMFSRKETYPDVELMMNEMAYSFFLF
ncbi:hypothetical protein MKQ68_06840 [Chitinophaga horti]|uniref:MORN repeat variant n=1 Tax=Chitinophaga horti TaxID=2920382 RepID=A0ABY6J554_9BACT|nr:hypothetical protein [Chitinophaga horti]UYQ94806.1 hypothetical protein MKQ68_06840 [Chitinophaga horti]